MPLNNPRINKSRIHKRRRCEGHSYICNAVHLHAGEIYSNLSPTTAYSLCFRAYAQFLQPNARTVSFHVFIHNSFNPFQKRCPLITQESINIRASREHWLISVRQILGHFCMEVAYVRLLQKSIETQARHIMAINRRLVLA
jgi:hypothetical protein